MAKNKPVWAIDIGNTSLKALQCRSGDEPGTVEALAFDYIEHSKILSQPGAEPAELVAESLETFLSRNSVKTGRVAISVSGQNTISRFLKLPPVDKKKLPDIIRLEAKQWLPFALDDVVWDYQPLIGGSTHGNMLVDSEIGMFAMKREFAVRAIVPFDKAGIPVDCIQSSPLALYNFAAFDQFDLTQLQGTEEGGTKGFSNYTIILCIGTDSSDVVITNGVKIWVRNITIGGNNFTKSLTKGMKLTFSNAEHLKRNAATSQDPKAVFQVMRPVYNELLTEVNRSVEFYSSLDRKAKFNKIITLGSSTKLPGLCQFLRQNLGYDVVPLKKYNKLVGEEVLAAPAFVENANAFGICYGLALQMMGEAAIATNLIPTEVVTRRIIAEKKPWLLAGAAVLMLGLIVPFLRVSQAFTPLEAPAMKTAESGAKSVQEQASKLTSETSTVVATFKTIDEMGHKLTDNVEGRIRWPELYHVLQKALPQNQPGAKLRETTTEPLTLALEDRIYVTNIEVQKVTDLSGWWESIKTQKVGTYLLDPIELPKEGDSAGTSGTSGGSTSSTSSSASTSMSRPSAMPSMSPSSSSSSSSSANDSGTAEGDLEDTGIMRARVPAAPEGKDAYIVQMSIYHYHNPTLGMRDQQGNEVKFDAEDIGAAYVRRTLFKNLRHNVVTLPASLSRQSLSTNQPVVMEPEISMQEFGFSHPVLLDYDRAVKRTIIDPDALRQAMEEAIVKERTQKIKAQGTRRPTTAAGVGTMGGGMTSYSTNAAETAMGPGGSGNIMGTNQNPLVDLARSNTGVGIGNTNLMSGQGGMERGTNAVLDMIKLLRDDQKLDANKFEAVVQFAWIPSTPTEREEARKAAQEKLLAAQAAVQGTDEQSPDDETTVDPSAVTPVDPNATISDPNAMTGQPDSLAVTPTTPPVIAPDDTTSPVVTPDDTTSP